MRLADIEGSLFVWGFPDTDGLDYLRGRAAVEGLFIAVPEMRPYLLGLKVMEELGEAPAFYLTDNMVGHLLCRGKVRAAVLFCEAFDRDGVVTVPGGLYVVHLLRFHGVPVSVRTGVKLNPSLFKDVDASTLCGRAFYERPNVVKPRKELVPWDLLG